MSRSIAVGAPLRHARTWRADEPLSLESGDVLDEIEVCYETWGELDDDGANAVLVCHALSGDSHAARHDADDDPGWWDLLIGPGRAIDTDRYFVVCQNVLGGCRGTTGPNFFRPGEDRPWGADFPVVTIRDMVTLQQGLIAHLGIERLAAVIGGSLGGLQAMTWAALYPERVASSIVVAASSRLSSQGVAFNVVGRNAIRHDAHFQGGQYYGDDMPDAGLAIARMLAHITYLSDESMRAKFDPTRRAPRSIDTDFEAEFSVGSYLAYQGDRFVERFDANSYLTLTRAMDLFDFGDEPASIEASLAPARCRWLFLSFSTDWLYPPAASRELVDALTRLSRPVSYCEIDSPAGHDSFLVERVMERGASIVGAFLDRSAGRPVPLRVPEEDRADEPTSIFHARRLDYGVILGLMPDRGSVVDLGCGDGELLSILDDRGYAPLFGVEREAERVAEAIARGLDVVHADLDRGVAAIPDRSFDVALLSQTLQSIVDVVGVLRELVRVADLGIVSFPNFAHGPMREMFMREGRLPKEEGLYAHEWFDTPNRRFPSILDFRELCDRLEIRVRSAVYIDSASGQEVTEDPNLNADLAVVAVSAAD